MVISSNITSTEGRLKENLKGIVENVIDNNGIDKKIQEAIDNFKIRTGEVTRFYHYLDKAEVKISNSNQKVVCKILHRFGGELIDYYTPVADRMGYCEKLKEPCIFPRGQLHCVVLNIHDEDSEEWLLLGYYSNKELVGVNPASPGNFKIVTRGGVNQYWIKFGYDGLDLRLPNDISTEVGEYNSDMEEKIPIDASNTYNKEEIDELLKSYDERIAYLEEILKKQEPTENEE